MTTKPNNVIIEETRNVVNIDDESPNNVVVRSSVTLAGKTRRHVHTQSVSSGTWTISHPLGGHPSVTVVDSAKNVVVGDVQYIDIETIVVTFNGEFSGYAFLT